MRRVLKALSERRDLGDLSTIEDGASVGEIRKVAATPHLLAEYHNSVPESNFPFFSWFSSIQALGDMGI